MDDVKASKKISGDNQNDHIIPAHVSSWMQRNSLPQGERNMKNAIRLVVLMLGLATTYVALAAPMLAAPDGGPIPTCNPRTGCGPNGR